MSGTNSSQRTGSDGGTGRRAFLAGAAGVAGAAVAGVGLAGPASAGPASNGGAGRPGPGRPGPDAGGSAQDRLLRERQYQVRVEAARRQRAVPISPHPTNGDEQRYPSRIGSDTRGLPHDARGGVLPTAWAAASKAYASRRWEDFEAIPLGGTRKFVNPVGTLAASLEGVGPAQLGLVPAPTVAGRERAAEIVENYWHALLRDVPFSAYAQHEGARAAAAELDRLPGYTGPRVGGRVTTDVLFRGTVRYPDRSLARARDVVPPGVLDGPLLSQFLSRVLPYGTQSLPATHRVPRAGSDFLTAWDAWLAVQDGKAPTATIPLDDVPRHVVTGRDLNEHAHGNSPLFWGAALLLGTAGVGTATAPAGVAAPLNPGNPYVASRTQVGGNGTFALGYLQALLTTGVSRAIRATYWQKWFVHRSVRPEAFAGLVHRVAVDRHDLPVHADVLGSQALARVRDRWGSALLPQAYPEGAPLHGSYPAGSAAAAGVQATLLKAFFDERHVIPNPVVPDPEDPTRLLPWTGAPLTVGGELNKLAVNYTFGRVGAGIHWRSDSAAGLWHGEQIALAILRDERLTFAEPFDGFRFTLFDGTPVTI